ncbi:hypothetical protein KAJ61_00100 [Candidatus Parcubacteria bacterium]|nr:hypothetical protein [Candidatus Parcubacteria bacterium]
MDKKNFLEIFYNANKYTREEIQPLVESVKKEFHVRVVGSSVYSYQGQMNGKHGKNPPETRPDDWAGDHFGYGDIRNGDHLLCLGTEDRYGYVDEQNLVYTCVDSIEEAMDFDLF